MDLITQGLAGALLAQSTARGSDMRRAALIGAIAGMLPDADIMIHAADDPLFSIEYHRHFTHSLLFAPFGALLVTLLIWPFLHERLSVVRIYGFALVGMLSAGLLDACTSFGTHLFWPLSDERIAWSLIAIVDPVFSLVLLIALLVAWRRRNAVPARFGIGVALLYLSLAFVQQQRAIDEVLELAGERGHVIKRLEVKPTLGNILLWRTLYQVENLFYVDAVRVGWFSAPRYYAGEAIARIVPDDLAMIPVDSVLMQDIKRFSKLADGYMVRHPERPWVLGDIRYAMLPNSIRPLWGIHINTALPDEHVEFLTLREMNPETRQVFLDMLLGRD